MTCNGTISVRKGLLCCVGFIGAVALVASGQTAPGGGRTASKEKEVIHAIDPALTTVAVDPRGFTTGATQFQNEGGIAGCPITCTDTEGEPDCFDNYVDATNGGCNSTPAVFTPITCGQTVCGDSGTYASPLGNTRDTDWWLINITAPTTITWTVEADFAPLIGFVGQPCPQGAFIGTPTVGVACSPNVVVSPVLAPGQYVAFVSPTVFTGVPCGSRYSGTLTTSNPDACVPSGRCCDGANCSVTSQANCAGQWTAGATCGSPGYVASTCGNALEDISGTGTLAALSSACDDCSDLNVPIGFSFNFFGNSYSTIRICSNGFASFDQAGPSTFGNVAIPNSAAPNDIVCPFWDDFNPGVLGDIYYQTLAGPQRFVVQWNGVRRFGATVGENTFQMILYATGQIEFRYGSMEGTPPLSGTVGIENATGTAGTSIDAASIGTGNTCRSLAFVTPPNPCNDCPGNIVTSGSSATQVDIDDLLAVIAAWGPCPAPPASCPANIATAGASATTVDIDDLLAVISAWGPCP